MSMNQVTLNLVVHDALHAMDFYEKVFTGIKGEVYDFPNRSNLNAAYITVGNLCLRLMDENQQYDCYSPDKTAIPSSWLQIEVINTDHTLKTAVENGATVKREPAEFMGIRSAEIVDPFGYIWTIQQMIEKISFEERYRLFEEIHQQQDEK